MNCMFVCLSWLCVPFVSIQRYAVIPLSTNSGLIGWVPHCDTLHALIRDYREKKKILLNIEHRIMLRVRNHYYVFPAYICVVYIIRAQFSLFHSVNSPSNIKISSLKLEAITFPGWILIMLCYVIKYVFLHNELMCLHVIHCYSQLFVSFMKCL